MRHDGRRPASQDKQKIQAATKFTWIPVLRNVWNKH